MVEFAFEMGKAQQWAAVKQANRYAYKFIEKLRCILC